MKFSNQIRHIAIFYLMISVSLQALAISFSVVGPCHSEPIFKAEEPLNEKILGDFTVHILKKFEIPFDGDRSGIRSIEHSPVGDEALEILSDTQMRSYGWCVAIDGHEPGLMPDQVEIPNSAREIVWFYASSLYDRGVWKDICKPSYQTGTLSICHSESSGLAGSKRKL